MVGLRRVALVGAMCLVLPVVSSASAAAARSLTVVPRTGLVEGQVVTVKGAGFRPSVRVAFCQAVMSAGPVTDNCGNVTGTTITSATGTFSENYTVSQTARFINNRTVDCWVDACYLLAAEVDGQGAPVSGTVTYSASLTFVHVQPDGQIRRYSDGAVLGNDVYERSPSSLQTATHPIALGSDWTFAVQVQNDGARTEDITVRAFRIGTAADITVRYFAGGFDVTAQVNSTGGFTFADVPPGAIRKIPIQFRASPSASPGAQTKRVVTFTGGAPVSDAVLVGVNVAAA